MAAIPYRTPDNQTIAGLRRLRAEGEAIQAKAKAAREAAAPHSGGRMLPPAEDLIGYTWDEDAILNDMLGVDDAMFGSHDAEGMVILTKADIPTAHLDKPPKLFVSDLLRALSLYMKHPIRVAPSNTSCSEDPKPENLNPQSPKP